jgi:hypothetical protein
MIKRSGGLLSQLSSGKVVFLGSKKRVRMAQKIRLPAVWKRKVREDLSRQKRE